VNRYIRDPADLLMCQCVAREACALEVSVLRPREAGTAPPGAMQGRVSAWRRLTHDVAAFDVDVDHPLDFDAGQFALLTVPGIAGARAYSMVNFEPGARRLSFVVKRKPGGAVSDWVFGDGVDGTPLGVFAPLGHATFRPGLGKHVRGIAGGSGHRGHDVDPPVRGRGRPLRGVGRPRLLSAVRSERDHFFLDELAPAAGRATRRGSRSRSRCRNGDVPAALAAAYPGLVFARGPRPRGGRRAHGRPLRRRPRLRGGPHPRWSTRACVCCSARRDCRPPTIRYDKFS